MSMYDMGVSVNKYNEYIVKEVTVDDDTQTPQSYLETVVIYDTYTVRA